MRFGAPIVPVVSIGGHETLIVLTEGRRLAEVTGLGKLGIERVPVSITFPWGLTLGAPVHALSGEDRDRGRPPIELKGFQHVRARSSAAVRAAHSHIVALMQRMLNRLAEDRAKKHPEPAVLSP